MAKCAPSIWALHSISTGTKAGAGSVARSGKNAAEALAQRIVQESRLNAKANGVAVIESSGPKLPLAAAVTVYLQTIKTTKKHRTFLAYEHALEYFLQSCRQTKVEDFGRSDMQEFAAFLRDAKELSPRSCWNKFNAAAIALGGWISYRWIFKS